MPKRERILNFDFVIFFSMLILIFIGIAMIYSAGYAAEYRDSNSYYIRQFIWLIVSCFVFAVVISINYQKFSMFTDYFYFSVILLLVITLIFGKTIHNTKGWISLGFINFQFSEISKIAVILMLSKYLDKYQKERNTIRDLVLPFSIVALPMFLILFQPDFGTAIVLPVIFFSMLFIAGFSKTQLSGLLTVSIISIMLPLISQFYSFKNPDSKNLIQIFLTNRYLLLSTIFILFFLSVIFILLNNLKRKNIYRIVAIVLIFILLGLFLSVVVENSLKPYQKKRLLVFIDSSIDPYGAGYNINQSIIAVGSGRFMGKGFLKGTQGHFGFLPAKQNDFIFAVISEEFGFAGAVLIISLISILLLKSINTIYTSKNLYGTLLATGTTTLLLTHIIINIGMVIGIMPVAGLPLPFLSYGGSFLITSVIAVGIIMNVKMRRYVH